MTARRSSRGRASGRVGEARSSVATGDQLIFFVLVLLAGTGLVMVRYAIVPARFSYDGL